MNQIETEIWKPNPDKSGYLQLERRRTKGEVFEELKAAVKAAGMEPDEYFSCLAPDEEIPQHRWIACYAVTGGSEGHYIHIEALCHPEYLRASVYKPAPNGDNARHEVEETRGTSVMIRHSIALGKTFEGMERAQAIANFCAKALGA